MKAEDPRDFISCSCNFVPTFVAFVLVFFPDLALAFVGAFDVDGGVKSGCLMEIWSELLMEVKSGCLMEIWSELLMGVKSLQGIAPK